MSNSAANKQESAIPPLAKPGHELRRLGALIGKWRSEGRVLASPESPDIRIVGTDEYQWLPGKFFLVHTVDVHVGDTKVDAIEIIGP